MSVPDEVHLNSYEKAALEDLERAACADDPALATKLRAFEPGGSGRRQRAGRIMIPVAGTLLVVGGLALVLVSLTGVGVPGGIGIGVMMAGLLIEVHALIRHLFSAPSS